MADKEGLNVDAQTRAELSEIKSDLHLTIINTISEGFKGLRQDLTEFFNKDFDHVNEKLLHFQANHREHFENDKDRRKDILDLGKRLDKFEVEHLTQDKLDEKTDRKKNTNYGLIVTLCTFFTLIGAIIGFFL